MHLLVVSRVSIPAKDRTLPAWEHLRSLGHEVTVEHPDSVPTGRRPDAMVSMGISITDETFRALDRFPGVPLYCYNWDCYEWVWEPGREGRAQAYHPIRNQGQQREYDYVRYGGLLRRAREVWVPSACTGRRTEQWWGLRNWAVVLSACPWWDPAPPNAVRDGGYALCTLREIPDPWWGVFERCCAGLGIPFKTTRHELDRAGYEDAVAGCRFLCAPLHELSTGGLTLLEGYRLGKPVLLSDSEWNGGRDYFGDRATYFRRGDEADFRAALRRMAAGDHPVRPDHREWVEANYNDRRMVEDMVARIRATGGPGVPCASS